MSKTAPTALEPLYPAITFLGASGEREEGWFFWLAEGDGPYGPFTTNDEAIAAVELYK